MNRIYLDQDRTIDAEISSDTSMQADEIIFKDKKITTKNLRTQFSLYIEEVKKEINKNLSAMGRNFYNGISVFIDEQTHGDKYRKKTLGEVLRVWRPKLQLFQQKLQDLKNNLPYLTAQKKVQKMNISRKLKFTEVIDKFMKKSATENNLSQVLPKEDIEQEIAQAQNLYDQGRFEQTLIKVRELLRNKQNERQPQFYFLLGNCYKAIGFCQEAIQQYNKAIKLDPKGSYYNNRGNCYLSLQDYIRAEQDYKRAIKQEPNNEIFLGNYGNVCLNLKKYEEAIISYNLALKAGIPNDFYYNNRAFAEIKIRRLDDAILSYNQAINLSPHNHVYLKNRANLYIEKGQIEEAINDISYAIELQPNKHQYYALKGKWEYFSKRPREALILFRRAYQLQPNKKAYMDYYNAIRNQLAGK